jgi:hypothetical protein
MSFLKQPLIYKIRNIFKKKNGPTPKRVGKKCITNCGYCGSEVSQESRLHFNNVEKQQLSDLTFKLKDGKVLACTAEVSNCDEIVDELNVSQFCYTCGAEFQNTLILKMLDINIIMFL